MALSKTKKLFISYRSSDAAKVDKIARDLALLPYDDGTPRYAPWQDKHNLPPASPSWWDAIVDAIIACDMFVFHLSQASLQSEVCRAELDYAHKRNRPIVPVVLNNEFFLNAASGKYDLPKATWALVPDWLGQQQFLFEVGTEFYGKFQDAVALYERSWPRDIPAPRPLNPDSRAVHGTNHALYDAACDYANRLAFADAEKHFDTLVRRNDSDYADVAAQWLELLRQYAELIEIVERRSAAFLFKKKWMAYEALFPKDFWEGVFDPKGFAAQSTRSAAPPPTIALAAPPVAAVSPPPTPIRPHSVDLLPAPFAWMPIAAGRVTLKTETGWSKNYIPEGNTQAFDVAAFHLAEYPLTNAQYALFIDAGGYVQDRWWTQAGWQQREQEKWTEPRYWQDARFNPPDHPVVGVSWYEAVAYCRWLSEVTGEAVRLPTEQEWQWAAQGKDGRDYPWGKQWDCAKCNNSVSPCDSNNTSPVRLYEGKGDSPFGVVDMVGNVWEWCSTVYKTGNIDLNHPRL